MFFTHAETHFPRLDTGAQHRIRACIFDVDGLLIDSEDLLTTAINTILSKYSYSHPQLTWSIKTQLQGRTLPESARLVIDWAGLPLTVDDFRAELFVLQQELFRKTTLLPGAEQLLTRLAKAKIATRPGKEKVYATKIELAIATSSQRNLYQIKTGHLSNVFDLIPDKHQVMGDDDRLQLGRGKPMPDIYLLALSDINTGRAENDRIKPEECLVFEDSAAGVEAGRRAGMKVVWVPHGGLRDLYQGREEELWGGSVQSTFQYGDLASSMWGETLGSLEEFQYEKYGIEVES